MKNQKFFSEKLLTWNLADNKREMPWKGEKDPYKIWVSEIILQQTRVNQGMSYYYKFIKSFPDIQTLATSPEQLVFKHWEGLGYYSRCRNLIESAKFIHTKLGGKFPGTFTDILSLKGIGNYTASAIASFAYNELYAVVDGNVSRVLARFFGIKTPANTGSGKKLFATLAAELLDRDHPAVYNQAIMDFGAIVCKPALPECKNCPLNARCFAFNNGVVDTLPVRGQNIKRKERFFNYLVVEYNNAIYARQRTANDIWQGLYEFILVETEKLIPVKRFCKTNKFRSVFNETNFDVTNISRTFRQKLTHQLIAGNFFYVRIDSPLTITGHYRLVSKTQLDLLPFPKFITSYLED